MSKIILRFLRLIKIRGKPDNNSQSKGKQLGF